MRHEGTGAPAPRRLIDLNESDLDAKLDARLAAWFGGAAATEIDETDEKGRARSADPDRAMPRLETARFLGISLSQLDILSRREADAIPYRLAGDSRRYLRGEVIEWLRRQREVAS